MAECNKISSGVDINCTDPIEGGVKDNVYAINYEDWRDAIISRNVSNNQIIEGISLPSGIVAYKFEGINNSPAPKQEMIKKPFINSFSHEVNYKLFSIGPDVKKQLGLKSKSRLVFIIENNYKGTTGNAAFEVYGDSNGLICEAISRDPNSTDTQGVYDVTFKSSEKSQEPHLPSTIFLTDYATSLAIVESLL